MCQASFDIYLALYKNNRTPHRVKPKRCVRFCFNDLQSLIAWIVAFASWFLANALRLLHELNCPCARSASCARRRNSWAKLNSWLQSNQIMPTRAIHCNSRCELLACFLDGNGNCHGHADHGVVTSADEAHHFCAAVSFETYWNERNLYALCYCKKWTLPIYSASKYIEWFIFGFKVKLLPFKANNVNDRYLRDHISNFLYI